jgi:hypothetical protein
VEVTYEFKLHKPSLSETYGPCFDAQTKMATLRGTTKYTWRACFLGLKEYLSVEKTDTEFDITVTNKKPAGDNYLTLRRVSRGHWAFADCKSGDTSPWPGSWDSDLDLLFPKHPKLYMSVYA